MSIQPAQRPHVENLLLARLLVYERNAVQRASAVVDCAPGQVLLNANTLADFMFFPIDAVLAPVKRLGDGNGIDLGLIGHEGLIGCDSMIARRKQVDDLVVRAGGTAYCMPGEDFRHQFDRRGGLHGAVLRFSSAFMVQLGQNALCSRFHALDARIARWLLMIHDRSGALDIDLSTEALAASLGTDGNSALSALERLAAESAIQLRKHSVTVTDVETLQMRACDCYDELRQIYAQVMPA